MQRRITFWSRLSSFGLAGLLAFGAAPVGAQEAMRRTAKGAPKAAARGLTEEQKVAHLLDRITYGARPGDLERVRKVGRERYLDEQLHPERIADEVAGEKLRAIPSINMSAEEIAKNYPPPKAIREALRERGMDLPGGKAGEAGAGQGQEEAARKRREARAVLGEMGYRPPQQIVQELQQAKLLRAVYSERQLQEVLTDFWMNHFNVFANKGADRWLITAYERDTIRPNVLGKFEDLLRATAESPAMLFYLDNWQSAAADSALRRGRDSGALNGQGKVQRARRGLNENYAREIMELHTLGVNGGYTQQDVVEVARAFTGWTIRNPRQGGGYYFNARMHDDGEKVVLGTKLPAGGGRGDGEAVIKLLARHPSTAKFISAKLARKFVSDNPAPALVDRTAQVFLKAGGDLRAVVRSLLVSPEFWAAESYRAKIKTPFEMTVSAARALGAETNGGPAFHRWIAQMGEPLFLAQPPTGYADTAETWVNTGALLQRMNFALALAANRIPGTRVRLDELTRGVDASRPSRLADHVIKQLLLGDVSPATRATLDRELSGPGDARPDERRSEAEMAKIVGLILGSPEFQRQ
jgi:uncharacterized protein (DUF1800 family)